MTETNISNKENKEVNSDLEKLRTIFTEEEIRSTVKAFVLAYLRGSVTIDFPTTSEIIDHAKKEQTVLNYKQASDIEVSSKRDFRKNVEIISGTKKSTDAELEKAINEIFSAILTYRGSHRIKGTFLEFDMEKKMDDFELKLNATNKVVAQLVKWLTEEAKGNDKMP